VHRDDPADLPAGGCRRDLGRLVVWLAGWLLGHAAHGHAMADRWRLATCAAAGTNATGGALFRLDASGS